jgi:hypothetical protein
MQQFLIARSNSKQFNLAFYQTESVFPELIMFNPSIPKDSAASRIAKPSDITQLQEYELFTRETLWSAVVTFRTQTKEFGTKSPAQHKCFNRTVFLCKA